MRGLEKDHRDVSQKRQRGGVSCEPGVVLDIWNLGSEAGSFGKDASCLISSAPILVNMLCPRLPHAQHCVARKLLFIQPRSRYLFIHLFVHFTGDLLCDKLWAWS